MSIAVKPDFPNLDVVVFLLFSCFPHSLCYTEWTADIILVTVDDFLKLGYRLIRVHR
jgi:hypothetical protein